MVFEPKEKSAKDLFTATTGVTGWKSVGLELLAFLFTAFMVFRESWSAAELVWALWVSSLLVGWAIISVWLLGAFYRDRLSGKSSLKNCLGSAAFFTFHYTFFHFGHAVFLTGFFPLENALGSMADMGQPNPGQLPALIMMALAGTAFFVAATLLARGPDIRNALTAEQLPDVLSYAGVIKMHIMIIFLGFINAALESYAMGGLPIVLIIVLMFHFFPFEAIKFQFQAFKNR